MNFKNKPKIKARFNIPPERVLAIILWLILNTRRAVNASFFQMLKQKEIIEFFEPCPQIRSITDLESYQCKRGFVTNGVCSFKIDTLSEMFWNSRCCPMKRDCIKLREFCPTASIIENVCKHHVNYDEICLEPNSMNVMKHDYTLTDLEEGDETVMIKVSKGVDYLQKEKIADVLNNINISLSLLYYSKDMISQLLFLLYMLSIKLYYKKWSLASIIIISMYVMHKIWWSKEEKMVKRKKNFFYSKLFNYWIHITLLIACYLTTASAEFLNTAQTEHLSTISQNKLNEMNFYSINKLIVMEERLFMANDTDYIEVYHGLSYYVSLYVNLKEHNYFLFDGLKNDHMNDEELTIEELTITTFFVYYRMNLLGDIFGRNDDKYPSIFENEIIRNSLNEYSVEVDCKGPLCYQFNNSYNNFEDIVIFDANMFQSNNERYLSSKEIYASEDKNNYIKLRNIKIEDGKTTSSVVKNLNNLYDIFLSLCYIITVDPNFEKDEKKADIIIYEQSSYIEFLIYCYTVILPFLVSITIINLIPKTDKHNSRTHYFLLIVLILTSASRFVLGLELYGYQACNLTTIGFARKDNKYIIADKHYMFACKNPIMNNTCDKQSSDKWLEKLCSTSNDKILSTDKAWKNPNKLIWRWTDLSEKLSKPNYNDKTVEFCSLEKMADNQNYTMCESLREEELLLTLYRIDNCTEYREYIVHEENVVKLEESSYSENKEFDKLKGHMILYNHTSKTFTNFTYDKIEDDRSVTLTKMNYGRSILFNLGILLNPYYWNQRCDKHPDSSGRVDQTTIAYELTNIFFENKCWVNPCYDLRAACITLPIQYVKYISDYHGFYACDYISELTFYTGTQKIYGLRALKDGNREIEFDSVTLDVSNYYARKDPKDEQFLLDMENIFRLYGRTLYKINEGRYELGTSRYYDQQGYKIARANSDNKTIYMKPRTSATYPQDYIRGYIKEECIRKDVKGVALLQSFDGNYGDYMNIRQILNFGLDCFEDRLDSRYESNYKKPETFVKSILFYNGGDNQELLINIKKGNPNDIKVNNYMSKFFLNADDDICEDLKCNNAVIDEKLNVTVLYYKSCSNSIGFVIFKMLYIDGMEVENADKIVKYTSVTNNYAYYNLTTTKDYAIIRVSLYDSSIKYIMSLPECSSTTNKEQNIRIETMNRLLLEKLRLRKLALTYKMYDDKEHYDKTMTELNEVVLKIQQKLSQNTNTEGTTQNVNTEQTTSLTGDEATVADAGTTIASNIETNNTGIIVAKKKEAKDAITEVKKDNNLTLNKNKRLVKMNDIKIKKDIVSSKTSIVLPSLYVLFSTSILSVYYRF